jgi:hypothetical protein
MADRSVVIDVSADLLHLKPGEIADMACCNLDRVLDGFLDAVLR